jgi:hypothetical protein
MNLLFSKRKGCDLLLFASLVWEEVPSTNSVMNDFFFSKMLK